MGGAAVDLRGSCRLHAGCLAAALAAQLPDTFLGGAPGRHRLGLGGRACHGLHRTGTFFLFTAQTVSCTCMQFGMSVAS